MTYRNHSRRLDPAQDPTRGPDSFAAVYPRDITDARISVDPDVMGGAPCVRGLRIPVATVVTMVADGMTTEQILDDLPALEAEDVAEALRFTAESVRERQLPLLSATTAKTGRSGECR